MGNGNSNIATLLGDIPEYGGGPRVLLPESYYNMTLAVLDTDTTDPAVDDEENPVMTKEKDGSLFEDANGEQVQRGCSPYVELECEADEGPFQGHGFRGRFWLTPGKGPNIGFVQHAAKAISSKTVNTKLLNEFGFEFPAIGKSLSSEALKQARLEAQQLFRKYFYVLSADDRLDFMVRYCRVGEWDGKSVVVKVGIEPGQERMDDTTGQLYTPEFNRYQGFHALNDASKGAGWVRSVCHRKQERAAVEMGLIEAPESPVSATTGV